MKARARQTACRRASLAAGLAMSITACSDDNDLTGPRTGRILEHVTPAFMEAAAGSSVRPAVKVLEFPSRKPLPGVTVEFRLRALAGAVENPVVVTDTSGVASAGTWTLPERAGMFVLDVVAGGMRTSFSVLGKAGPPSEIRLLDSTVVGLAGEDVPGPVVLVLDRFGNPVNSGVPVTFAVTEGGGRIGVTAAITNNNGRASPVSWSLGTGPGDNVLTAAVEGAPTITARTRALDRSSLLWYELESIAGLSLAQARVDSGTIGFTRFDRCLCANEAGYFVLHVWPRNGTAIKLGGRYRIEASSLRFLDNAGEIWGLDAGAMAGFSIRDQARGLEGSRIRIEIWRYYPEWWEWWPETWIFREAGP